MKETLIFILQSLVDVPTNLSVTETQQEGKIILSIKADPSDIGKIIGKSGRIIRAIRDLIKIIAVKHNQYVDVVITENDEPQS
ncbi:KH domain-containing protein [Candidatus Gottesmanbacteria bacterium]|nr:KH domain-containing protein [Candidatus Gottesmanbacteria bacterium]